MKKINKQMIDEAVKKTVIEYLKEDSKKFKIVENATGIQYNVKAATIEEAKQKLGKYLKERKSLNEVDDKKIKGAVKVAVKNFINEMEENNPENGKFRLTENATGKKYNVTATSLEEAKTKLVKYLQKKKN
jgi:hypothetical protein